MLVQSFIIDTFTSEKCSGNPTAVCFTTALLEDDTALSIARKYNVPVTAFMKYPVTGEAEIPIRYFTMLKEIPACGHATLASAKAISELFADTNPLFKTTEDILLQVMVHDDIITMTYPKYELTACPVSESLLQSLQIDNYSSAGFCPELETLFIELDNPTLLKSIQPDYPQLVASSETIKEVVITSTSDDTDYDFLLRSFCPWIGIDEDPVTGSVHSVLAGFWKAKLEKVNLKAYQASQQGGEIFVTALHNKVQIGGKAVIRSMEEWRPVL
jgi:PhzF family phenazine biosynthesis protein